jgi:hypothetical protein
MLLGVGLVAGASSLPSGATTLYQEHAALPTKGRRPIPTRSQLAGGGRSGSHAAAVTATHKPTRIKRPATSKPIEVTIISLLTLGLPAIFQGKPARAKEGLKAARGRQCPGAVSLQRPAVRLGLGLD